jgi:hypothetical protein
LWEADTLTSVQRAAFGRFFIVGYRWLWLNTGGGIVMLRLFVALCCGVSLSACDITPGNTFASPSGAVVNTAKFNRSSDACFKNRRRRAGDRIKLSIATAIQAELSQTERLAPSFGTA